MAFLIQRRGPDLFFDELAGALLRRKLVILVTLLGTIVAVFVSLSFMQDRYEAVARLLMVLGRENIQAPVTVQNGNVYASGVQREEINSEIQLLRSRQVISAAVNAVGLDQFRFEAPPPQTLWQYFKYAVSQTKRYLMDTAETMLVQLGLKTQLTDEEKTLELVEDGLSVSREADSNVINVNLDLPDKSVAETTLGEIIDFYLQRHVAVRSSGTVLPLQDTQVEKDRAELAALQQERLTVIQDWGLSSGDTQVPRIQERLQKVLYEADAKRTELAQTEERNIALKKRIATLPALQQEQQTVEPNTTAASLKERLADLLLKRADATNRYKDLSMPLIRRLDDEIKSVEAIQKSEGETQTTSRFGPHPIRQALEEQRELSLVQISALKAAIQEDERHVQSLNVQLAKLNEGQGKLNLVELSIQAAEKRFLTDSSRRDEARINEALDLQRITNVAVLSAPSVSPEPVAPRKLRIMIIGILAGLVMGVGLAMFLEWGDDTIYGLPQLSRLTRSPILGEFRVVQKALRVD